MRYGLFCLMAILTFYCAKNTTSKDTTTSDISDAIEGQITTINTASADINAGSGSTLAMVSPAERRFLNEESLWQNFSNLAGRLFDNSLHAAACASSGSVNDSGANFGTTAFTITRTWSQCVRDNGAFKRDGLVYLDWSGLLTTQSNGTYVTSNTALKRATSNLTMTRIGSGNYVEISGNDTTNAVSGTNANNYFRWGVTTATTRPFTLDINETRVGKTSGGATVFRHIITTPTTLSVTTDTAAQTRTITSGSIRVQHVLANFNVTTTFSNTVWDLSTCQPKSGTATVVVNGSVNGSGSITFSNGTVSFTYGTASGSLTLPGC